mgnify:CR=1 FL=1
MAASKTFAFQARGRYYKRRTAKVLPCLVGFGEDGAADLSEPTPGMVTRWGYQGSRYRRPHDAYLVNGIWCEVRNVPTGFGPDGKPCEWAHAWAACSSRTLRDRHERQSEEQGIPAVTLTIRDGALTAATTRDGEDLAVALDPWDLEKALGID